MQQIFKSYGRTRTIENILKPREVDECNGYVGGKILESSKNRRRLKFFKNRIKNRNNIQIRSIINLTENFVFDYPPQLFPLSTEI